MAKDFVKLDNARTIPDSYTGKAQKVEVLGTNLLYKTIWVPLSALRVDPRTGDIEVAAWFHKQLKL